MKKSRLNPNRSSENLNAKANLLAQERLATKAARQNELGKKVEAAEAKLPKTSNSLSALGAGQNYGAS